MYVEIGKPSSKGIRKTTLNINLEKLGISIVIDGGLSLKTANKYGNIEVWLSPNELHYLKEVL